MFDGLLFLRIDDPTFLRPKFIFLNIYEHSAYSSIYIYIYIYITFVKTLFNVAFNVSNIISKFGVAVLFYVLTYKPCTVCSVCYDLLPNSTFLAPMIRWLSSSNRKLQQMFAQSRFVLHSTKILYTKKKHIFHAFSIHIISRSKRKGR